jgi:hypothetical protein
MREYSNLLEAIDGLRKEGYTEDFNLLQDCIVCRIRNFRAFHNEFVIDKFHRIEGDSDPTEQSIIYAISSDNNEIKGILINSYGLYSDPVNDEMLEKLKIA